MSNIQEIKVIKNGMLINGTGKEPIKNATIIIKGTTIETIGEAEKIKIPSNAKIIDATGKTVLPGLIDSHVHINGTRSHKMSESIVEPEWLGLVRAVADMKQLLESGFTSCRDCGSVIAPLLKRGIEEGTIPGPRIIAAGKMISQTGGHGDVQYLPLEQAQKHSDLVDGKDECLKAVRKHERENTDFIKICTSGGSGSMLDPPEQVQFTVEEIKTITDEAHRWGKRVATHCYPSEGIINSVKGGVDTIEHGSLANEEAMQTMIDHNVIMVTTASIHQQINKFGKKWGSPPWTIERAPRLAAIETIKRAHKMGVKLAIGTDFSGGEDTEMGKNALELEIYVEKCGIPPLQAISSATKIGAEAIGLGTKIGTIERGKLADIIVVEGNPLDDIKILQNQEKIKVVIKNGVIAKKI